MKRYFYIFIIFVLCSCIGKKRTFFQSLKSQNYFLDTFSLSNLKGFGLGDKAIFRKGKVFFEFNGSNNSIYTVGYFSNDSGKISFLPEQSDQDLFFMDDSSLWNNEVVSTKPLVVKSKSQTVYEVDRLGLIYNVLLNDSTLLIRMRVSNILNKTETLIFEVSKKLDVVGISQINCKNDTLLINFFPKGKVYFKNINKESTCL